MKSPKAYCRLNGSKGAARTRLMLPAMLSAVALVFAAVLSGCSDSAKIPTSPTSGPQLYMAPVIYGGTSSVTDSVAMYHIDDTALPTPTFAEEGYSFIRGQSGLQINYSGEVVALSRGLQELESTYANGLTYNPPQAGSGWAVELAGQDGGLLQLNGLPFVPLVPAITCPSMKSAETFLFVTLPARLITAGTDRDTWNPRLETAYGNVDINGSGTTVTLTNIKQYTLPSVPGGAPGAPANPSASNVTSVCSPTVYGNTVAVPANPAIVTDSTGTTTISPQAMIGIGPSGLLVEDNGSQDVNAPKGMFYENVLGAGTGAIGLPKPSSAVDASSLVGAQYLGFFYGSGAYSSTTNWSSSVASFGFPTLPSTCATVAPQTSTMLYGGDFAGNNPASTAVQNNGGFPTNCDFAIDLGEQDTNTNGLFPNATVYVGSGFRGNTTAHNFKAVAIVGQLNGKYAIFLIGEDTTGSINQAWGIYLLQSN